MKITVTKATIPPCCANCQFNNWNEDGPHCVHPAHWNVLFAKIDDESGGVVYFGEEETEGGEVEWLSTCEHHLRGQHSDMNQAVIDALRNDRLAEFKSILKAQDAEADAKRAADIAF
jgi:hypothetical protein